MSRVLKKMLIVALLPLTGCFFFGDIAGEEARRLVAQNEAMLLDVRSPEEFADGHIDGAVNIPIGDLALRHNELGDKTRTIIVYCRSGMRSSRAQDFLLENGYRSVYNLGRMGRWK